ncbi:LysR family transcriptional regulator [Pollutimonas subterranea]|uniref:LysR family transcriptional regulator n=1 Tax=Pollutimonas subterranea TaxID=2045210 RepID=A0A2N4U492_9BURK|nr:LysR substrate-binding domain-containing protein [Pollutimonas subterranea]PLC49842.1 LysR family transcriptional regulator [Pollutimonas subterranea]
MKLKAFETLSAVLAEGNFAAAAKVCHLTPSAVSLQMKQIETYLGQQLFDRSRLKVKPLPRAYDVAEAMQVARERLGELRRDIPMTIEGHLRVGIIETMQPLLLPQLIRGMRRSYPKLHLQIQRGKSLELTDAVKAGEIDAAVVGQSETGGSARLHWFPLMVQPLVMIAPPNAREDDPAELFRRHEWIRYDRRTVAGRLAARYVKQHFGAPHAELELDAVRAVMAMVNAGLGVSIVQLSEPGVLRAFPVKVIELDNAPSLRFSLVMRRSEQEERLLGALCEVIRTFLPEPSIPSEPGTAIAVSRQRKRSRAAAKS